MDITEIVQMLKNEGNLSFRQIAALELFEGLSHATISDIYHEKQVGLEVAVRYGLPLPALCERCQQIEAARKKQKKRWRDYSIPDLRQAIENRKELP